MSQNTKNPSLFRDCMWALGAYIRGKVFKNENYTPHEGRFLLASHVNTRRITFLMLCWGFRPMTIDEVMEFMAYPHPLRERLWVDCTCDDCMPTSEGHGARVFIASSKHAA